MDRLLSKLGLVALFLIAAHHGANTDAAVFISAFLIIHNMPKEKSDD